jgi:hypothetical protein
MKNVITMSKCKRNRKKTYVTRKGKQTFEGLVAGETMVKMKKPRKKKPLTLSWEGPYQFVGYADGNGHFDFEEGSRICIIKDADEHQWERSRWDLQIYPILHD